MLRSLSTLPQPIACVLGDLNLVRPLAGVGIACAVPSNRGMARHSRLVRHIIDLRGAHSADEVVGRLLDFGASFPDRPVIFYQADADLLMLSRNRSLLAERFRFLLAKPDLIETISNKLLWAGLAQRLDLPVPAAVTFDQEHASDLRFPVVIKPAVHEAGAGVGTSRLEKAYAIESRAELAELFPDLADLPRGLVAQEMIRGPESSIESYHVYVDAGGNVAAEFTGRKIRTLPRRFGTTTALEVVDLPDVRALGRRIVELMEFVGVAKLDIKRGPDGRLWLLEVNARFTLWNNAGAAAGVNIPAIVWADLTGRPRPLARLKRARTTWWHPNDVRARSEWGVSLVDWVTFIVSAQTRSGLAWDDPSPILHAVANMARRRADRIVTITRP